MSENWRVNDPEWMAERKSEWRIIRKNLEQTEDFNIDIRQIRALEKYFLTGKESDFHNIPLIFKLWFHPDRSEDNWERLSADTAQWDYEESLRILKEYAGFSGGCRFSPPYGFMGGLEHHVFEFLLGNGRGIRTVTDDYGRPCELDLSRHKLPPEWILSSMTTWLYAPDSNPYTLCQYMADYWFEEITDTDDQWFVRNETELREFLIRIFVFVEPSGFQGDDTPQKRFADKFRKMLDTGELPDRLRHIWEDVQKPEGRKQWLKAPEEGFVSDTSFNVYMIHGKYPLPDAVGDIISVVYELGFTDRKYHPEHMEHVDFTNSLRPQFKRLLGYSGDERVPAFRYSVFATPEMTDAEEAHIRFDLLQLCHAPAFKLKPSTPLLVWLSRPDKPYVLYGSQPGSMTLAMNLRLLHRTILAKTGLELRKVTDKNKPYPKKMMPILNKPKYDLPLWKES